MADVGFALRSKERNVTGNTVSLCPIDFLRD